MRTKQSERTIFLYWFTVFIDRILFPQGITHGHDHATLDLPFTGQWIDSLSDIMRSNDLLHLTGSGINHAHLGRISIRNMRHRIRHICAKRICLCKVFSIINDSLHILKFFSCSAVFHQFLTGSAAGLSCDQSLSGTGRCSGIRRNPGIVSLIHNIIMFQICVCYDHLHENGAQSLPDAGSS